jgi:ubiquinone/menaquinone biosynthesis C-methylase UbiE
MDFLQIYATQAENYEMMIAAEDVDGNLPQALSEIRPFLHQKIVEFGAGTGRLTEMMAPTAKFVWAFDQSPQMLAVAQNKLLKTNRPNWSLQVADNFHLPLPDKLADIVIEGWSFGHFVSWNLPDWQPAMAALLAEMDRLSQPGATQILLETLGTGHKQPHIIFPEFGYFLHWLENEHRFQRRWIRTDYLFASPLEAAARTRFFFGDELADSLLATQSRRLPECTGIWWRTFDQG